ncbi:hypothetical protein BH09VER1_BH09VER1_49140 [soil metagenome]
MLPSCRDLRRFLLRSTFFFITGHLLAADPTLRVDYVNPAPVSFAADNTDIIFHDEFDQSPKGNPAYLEYTTEKPDSFVQVSQGGLSGGAMQARYDQGQVTVGTLKVVFGRKAFSEARGLRRDETFREIYWRVYVKYEAGWEGNPAKLGRATCLVDAHWRQGFIAHIWGGPDDALCIDPATGISDSRVVTTKYNDFDHLRWLGCRKGKTPIFNTAESGRWVCVESHVKLNTPGQADGIFELFVDGRLEAEHHDLDWHGLWQDYAINAVFLENYWNAGSPKTQSRWLDDFVISTKPIGPIGAARPVVIHRTHAAAAIPWEAEIAADSDGHTIVWKSHPIPADGPTVTADRNTGAFTDAATSELPSGPDHTYWIRVRQIGQPEWSPWYFPFR